MHRASWGASFWASLQFRDCGLGLPVRRQHSTQLHVGACIGGMQCDQLAQHVLCVGEAMAPHVDVRQAGQRVGRGWLERQHLLVFLFGVGEPILFFQQRAGGKMRLGIFGIEMAAWA